MEVIIVGAGACGLMAGRELVKKGISVTILEARERPGGRIHSVQKGNSVIELGAEFVHGPLPLTLSLLKEARIATKPFEGAFLQFENGGFKNSEELISGEEALLKALSSLHQDLPLDEALSTFSLPQKTIQETKDYVEGYYAADTSKASAKALVHDLENGFETQYTIPSGYISLVKFLEREIINGGGKIHYGTEVNEIILNEAEVEIKTSKGSFRSSKIIITIPPSILLNIKDLINPFPQKYFDAFSKLGFGNVIKVLLLAKREFWKNSFRDESAFIFSEEKIPTWWKSEGMVLSGWIGGPSSLLLTPETAKAEAMVSLKTIFPQLNSAEDIEEVFIWDWNNDPYAGGAYSYDVPGGEKLKDIILEPLHGKIYFSGEALHKGPMIGTVEAALQTGQDSAQQILAGVV